MCFLLTDPLSWDSWDENHHFAPQFERILFRGRCSVRIMAEKNRKIQEKSVESTSPESGNEYHVICFFFDRKKWATGWWVQIFFGIFTPIWGRWTHFDDHIFQRGGLKPPTRNGPPLQETTNILRKSTSPKWWGQGSYFFRVIWDPNPLTWPGRWQKETLSWMVYPPEN